MSLAELVVIDLTQGVAGPYCTKLLADYGADVIKVEPPSGDPARALGPFAGDEPHPERSGLFTYLNVNKRGVTLDLATAEDRDWLWALIARADVLVESFVPGELARLGLDPTTLLEAYPHLVITSVTPFGQTGPYRTFRAPELVIQAISGWMAGNGDPDKPPLKVPGRIQSGVYGGLFGAIATMGAVRRRRRTGQGEHIDLSVMESVLYSLPNVTTTYQYSGKNWSRRASYPPESPPSGIFACRDGLIGSSAVYQSEWGSFCRLIERPDLEDDPRFKTRAERIANADALVEIIERWLASRTAEDVYRTGQALKVPIALISTPRDLHESPQLAAREFWATVRQPGLGEVRIPGAPFKLPAGGWELRRPAPRLGEHNAEILAAAGSAPELSRPAPAGQLPRPATAATTDPRPLAGVRVLDLCMAWAGPLSTRILAALGAEVIKIEGPQHMDRWRGGSIPSDRVDNYPDRVAGERPYNRYALANTQNLNKVGLGLDLKHPRGKEIFKRLVGTADLVVENFSAGALGRLGLDYPALREINPSIILVSLPSFGRSGPERDYVGHANFVEDIAGNTFLFGYPGGPPLHTGTAWGDPVAGVTAALAALTALLHRDSTGVGQHVDVAHLEAAIPFNAEAMLDYALNGRIGERRGNDDPSLVPHGCYPTRGDDSWLTIVVESDAEWQAFVEAIGEPAWARDARFLTAEGRREHREDLDWLIHSWTVSRDHVEAMEILQACGVSAGAVLTAGELCRDPHLAARGFLVEVTHPEAGKHRYPRPPWLYASEPTPKLRPAPCFGEHNHRILKEVLSLSSAEISELEAAGVIAAEPLPQYGV